MTDQRTEQDIVLTLLERIDARPRALEANTGILIEETRGLSQRVSQLERRRASAILTPIPVPREGGYR